MSLKLLKLVRDTINLIFVVNIFFGWLFYYLSGFLFDSNKVRFSIAFLGYTVPIAIALFIDNYIARVEGNVYGGIGDVVLGWLVSLFITLLFFHLFYYLTNGQILYSVLAGIVAFFTAPFLLSYLKKIR